MQRNVNTTLIIRRAAIIAALIVAVTVAISYFAPQALPAGEFAASPKRIIPLVLAAATDLKGLILLCAAAGLFVVKDRQRRARVRQASS